MSRDRQRCGSSRGGDCGVCRRCDCRHPDLRHPDLSHAIISLLDLSRDQKDDTHTVIVPCLELRGTVGAAWPKYLVPVVQFFCGYVVVLGEDDTVVASFCLGILLTIRSDIALSGVLKTLASREWLATSAGGTVRGSWYTNTVIVTDPKLRRAIMPIGVSKSRVPRCKLCKCNVKAL